MTGRTLLGITMGDPAGIGAEVICKAAPAIRETGDFVVVGDAMVMRDACEGCETDLRINPIASLEDARFDPATIDVLDLENVETLEHGIVDADYGRASLEYVERAIDLALAGDVDAIVTAPINKEAISLAGAEFAGHTGLLADRTETDSYSMLLVEGDLRVSHVSTHVPLREAVDRVTVTRVLETVEVTDEALCEIGIHEPTIAVAGLNPHASDGGVLGDEEEEAIRPAIERARERGINARGPESPDTIYVRAARGEFDGVVAMYHDQGHIPIKMLGFSHGGAVSGVNVTIGLPIVRTSVDHGTAFDIAGQGVASEASMVDAARLAVEMAERRRRMSERGEMSEGNEI